MRAKDTKLQAGTGTAKGTLPDESIVQIVRYA